MAVNFKELLSKPVESAERPKPRPAGPYHGVIEGFKFDESKKQKTPFVRLNLTQVTPSDGIDLDALEAAGGTSKWKPHKDFYLTEDALFRLRELIESCDIDAKGRNFNETIPELKGKSVIFDVLLENSTNESTGEMSIFNNIGEMHGA